MSIPNCIIVAGLHLELVTTVCEVGIIRDPLRAAIHPIRIKTLHSIFEAHFLRCRKTEGRVMNFQSTFAGRHCNHRGFHLVMC